VALPFQWAATSGGTVEDGVGSEKAFGDGIGGCGIGVDGAPSMRRANVAALMCLGQTLEAYWMRRGE
jgi:hypothetical protein